jgi:Fe2+ or Zn2+ uptake regulation protein
MKQAGKLCESEAFEILAERHRGTALSIFTIVAGRGDEPDRAMVKCSKCGATFEFHNDGGWHLMEKISAVVSFRRDQGSSECPAGAR